MIDLGGIKRVYIDSNIFIYFAEFKNPLGDVVRAQVDAIIDMGHEIIVSRLALLECIYKPARDGDLELVALYRFMLTESPEIDMVELEDNILDAAATKGGRLGLKLQDAIHYFTALYMDCDVFLTNDVRFKSTGSMKVMSINPSTS
jgi:predicted nucleic acid-binding protein